MTRTPIKIPGKNMRDQSKAGRAASKALKRLPGRPPKAKAAPKPEPSDTSIKSANIPKKRSLKHIKSRHKMSLLEKLPTELMVEVFIHSMNTDLPRSSPVIAGKLTSELVYIRTVIEAFGPTWENGFGKYTKGNRGRVGVDFPPDVSNKDLDRKGDAGLQSAILRCRWASLSVLQKSLEIWVKRYAKERNFTPIPSYVNEDEDKEIQIQRDRLERKLTPAEYFDEDFAAFLHYVESGHDWETGNGVPNGTTYINVAHGVEIPQSLLLGPWTEEMTRHLYWLVKGGAKLDWLASTSGEAAMLGFKTAVSDAELPVIHLLYWAGLEETFNIELAIWAVQNARKNRLKVVKELLYMHVRNLSSQWMLDKAMAEVRDKAVLEADKETLAFVDALNAWMTFTVYPESDEELEEGHS